MTGVSYSFLHKFEIVSLFFTQANFGWWIKIITRDPPGSKGANCVIG